MSTFVCVYGSIPDFRAIFAHEIYRDTQIWVHFSDSVIKYHCGSNENAKRMCAAISHALRQESHDEINVSATESYLGYSLVAHAV